MRGLFINDMGACSCAPIKRKEIAPAVLAAIIGAGAQVASTVGSSIASSNLNADNRDFSREMTAQQNEFNALEAEKSRQHQSELLTREQDWNEQMYNLYNSPSAMMRQYKDAGLNPYLVDAQPSHGQSMASPSAPSSAQAVGASYGSPNTYVPDFSGLGKAGEMYLMAKQVDANVANTSAKTLKEAAEAYTSLRGHGMSSDDAKSIVMPFFRGSQGFEADSDRFFGLLNLEYDRNSIARDYESLRQSIYAEFGRTEQADKIMNMEQQFSVLAAEIGRMAVQNKFDERMIDRVASEIARNFASAGLDSANAGLIRRSMEYLVNTAEYEARSAWFDQADKEGRYNINKPIYEAAKTDLGQSAELVDYYTDKVVDKVSKLMKVNIGVSRSKSDKNYYIHNNE